MARDRWVKNLVEVPKVVGRGVAQKDNNIRLPLRRLLPKDASYLLPKEQTAQPWAWPSAVPFWEALLFR